MLVNGLIVFFNGVPFIHCYNNSLTPFMGNSCNLGVLFRHSFGGVNHHHHHVGPLHSRNGADNAEPLQFLFNLALSS